MYTDQTLTCIDCAVPFVFTSSEQDFYAARGFTNKPSRCPDCRAARKAKQGPGGGSSRSGGYSSDRSSAPREMFEVTCSQCGGKASVPFQPRGDKPVYCRDCFQSHDTRRSRA
jgi:CxxC-x17-CxxC domain-containing protein